MGMRIEGAGIEVGIAAVYRANEPSMEYRRWRSSQLSCWVIDVEGR